MFFAASAIIMLFVYQLLLYIFYAIGGYRIFTKFGEPGWKAFVPFYNVYIQYTHTWNSTVGIIVIALMLAVNVCSGMAGDNSTAALLLNLCNTAYFVLNLVGNVKLSRSFSHGIPFALGLTFLQPIFVLILGFGSDEYIGNTTEK